MSKSRFYNLSANISNDIEESNIHIANNKHNTNNGDNNEDNEDDSEFLQDIPYSSSSVDRSSMGSIPWADDAIKQNQLDWEQVELMLSGEEVLPADTDLRNEILEWQEKFPSILGKKEMLSAAASQNNFSNKNYNIKPGKSSQSTLPDDLISNLSLNSSDDDDRYDDLDTPTAAHKVVENSVRTQPSIKVNPKKLLYADKLAAKMALLQITALPLRLSQRSESSRVNASRDHGQSGMYNSLNNVHKTSPKKPQQQPKNSQFEQQQLHRLRMPPILNVLESKKRFRDLASNKSFVQLTHVKTPPQTKSAAIIRQSNISSPTVLQRRATPSLQYTSQHQHQTVWQRPLIATRVSSNFFNNRNAIILPSLNTQRIGAQQQRRNSTTSTGAGTRTTSLTNSNLGTSPSSSADLNSRPHYTADRFHSRWQQLNTSNNHHTSTSTGTISTGRSISAAIRHIPKTDTGVYGDMLYVPSHIPYKHDGFK